MQRRRDVEHVAVAERAQPAGEAAPRLDREAALVERPDRGPRGARLIPGAGDEFLLHRLHGARPEAGRRPRRRLEVQLGDPPVARHVLDAGRPLAVERRADDRVLRERVVGVARTGWSDVGAHERVREQIGDVRLEVALVRRLPRTRDHARRAQRAGEVQQDAGARRGHQPGVADVHRLQAEGDAAVIRLQAAAAASRSGRPGRC